MTGSAMDFSTLQEMADRFLKLAGDISSEASHLKQILGCFSETQGGSLIDPLCMNLIIFCLACFIGYYVVWNVTPALHSPLMSVTNAISSVVIVGAIIAAGPDIFYPPTFLGWLGVFLASINIFGGFIVTQRMLSMFSKNR